MIDQERAKIRWGCSKPSKGGSSTGFLKVLCKRGVAYYQRALAAALCG